MADTQDDEIRPEMAVEMHRLGTIFALLTKAKLELDEIAATGQITDAFTLGDSTDILTDVVRRIEEVRDVNGEFVAEFDAGLEAAEANADNSLHAPRPKISLS